MEKQHLSLIHNSGTFVVDFTHSIHAHTHAYIYFLKYSIGSTSSQLEVCKPKTLWLLHLQPSSSTSRLYLLADALFHFIWTFGPLEMSPFPYHYMPIRNLSGLSHLFVPVNELARSEHCLDNQLPAASVLLASLQVCVPMVVTEVPLGQIFNINLKSHQTLECALSY